MVIILVKKCYLGGYFLSKSWCEGHAEKAMSRDTSVVLWHSSQPNTGYILVRNLEYFKHQAASWLIFSILFLRFLGGIQTHQDGTQFEDALRRLHALEKKLTGQVGNVA